MRMNKDFHYYGTYAAARLAGYSAQDALVIARSAGFVDECTLDVLRAVMEEADGHEALKGLHDDPASIIPTAHSDAAIRAGNREWSTAFLDEVLRTWPCFHYLPGNFSAHGSVLEYQGATSDLGTYSIWYYDEEAREQFKLLCLPNSPTVKGMVNILKQKRASHLHAVGLCMHVLADTWAHQYFAGIPAWFMNDVQMEDMKIQDLTPPEPKWYDDLVPLLQDNPHYNSMAFLGHALAGHQPDYACQSFSMKAQWAKKKLKRDNPSLFMSAFKQMLYALQCINSTISGDFDLNTYADLGHDSISTDKNAELIDNVLRSGKSDQSREWCNCLLFLSLRDGGINPPEVATLRRCENDWGQGSISPEDLAAFQEAAKAHLQDVKAILAGHRIFVDDIPPERVVPLRLQLALKMPASDDAAMGRKILADLLRKVWIEQGRSASVRDRMEKRALAGAERISLSGTCLTCPTMGEKPVVLEAVLPGDPATPGTLKAGQAVKLRLPPMPQADKEHVYLCAWERSYVFCWARDWHISGQKWVFEQKRCLPDGSIDIAAPLCVKNVLYADQPYLGPHRDSPWLTFSKNEIFWKVTPVFATAAPSTVKAADHAGEETETVAPEPE